MLSRFFIDRPVFANVIAIVTMLVGAIALWRLPVERYPDITPPTVRITATYPGANAKVVADTVAVPVEQQVNGVENMLYMSSTCSSDGTYNLTVTFEIGTDLNDAQVLVQNRVSVAMPLLPEEVRRQGVIVKKQSSNIILVVGLTSTDKRHDALYLANYANLFLRDELSRVKGVGDVTTFGGSNYSMRIWLDPERLKARQLTTQDVIAAISEQNIQVAAGQIGQQPSPDNQNFQLIITAMGQLNEAKQFEKIVVKTGSDGRLTYLKDVARVELGAQMYDQFSERSGQQTASLGIFQLPGANAMDVAKGVRETIDRLSTKFEPGMKADFPLDISEFIGASIHEVYKTLIEAGILVLVVILLFLQDWRAVLVPATTVPVTIIGAFTALYMLGFSVNMLTLFGLVLAIGIVVDDAIVIVEAAAHNVEQKMTPRAATIRAMEQVLGPIIGITLVLLAVFGPSAFLGGITGQLYRQFALTIAATALISAVNAITLKPAQCAVWLRPQKAKKNWFFRGFNYVYDRCSQAYVAVLRQVLRFRWAMMALFVGLITLTAWWYNSVPTGFLPVEDQGYIVMLVQLPDAASLQRTHAVIEDIDEILKETPGVQTWFSIGGISFADNSAASNMATLFVRFKDWGDRKKTEEKIFGILMHINGKVAAMKDAFVVAFPPPAINGLGVRAGFQMQLEEKGEGSDALQLAVQELMAAGNTQSAVKGTLNSQYRSGVPQVFIDVDREKVKALDVPLSAVFNTLQANLGSAYVNDFVYLGRIFQVRVQADQKFRLARKDIERLEVRNRKGAMVPLGALVNVQESFGPQVISRYNLYQSAAIMGEPAPGFSSGEALRVMEQVAKAQLPQTMGYEWTGMAYQEKRVGGEAVVIFAFAVLLVYLVLAAQYESWILPLAVILVVPLGMLGAIALVSWRGMDNNVYTQIGIVLIIALASKNAILIVEYARDLRMEGRTILDAAIEASRLRFRPILMTSFAFILGVLPLVFADGAGAAGQQALGTAVCGGMLTSTFLAVFFVPVFYVVLQGLREWRRPTVLEAADEGHPALSAPHVAVLVHEGPSTLGNGDSGNGHSESSRPPAPHHKSGPHS
ncbi:MAG: multidrug efflux RND transporter permease subunit [Planctomycetes bacterium]|nr:multidrug efflux RND transporter permease subunit [Planctomycetota bacterium]